MLDEKIIDNLIDFTDKYCVSIYVPTHRAGQNQEDRIRFKNAIADAETKLIERGAQDNEVRKMLTKAKSFIDNSEFWLHQSDGLSMFISPEHFSYYQVPVRFEPFVMVHDHFYLRPLLPLMSANQKFMILALSLKEVKLFEAGPYSITPVNIKDLVPAGIKDMMQYVEAEESLQHHESGKQGAGAIYHGQGSGKELDDVRILEYFRQINDGLQEIYQDNKMPMVIACVDYLFPIFQQANTYPHLVQKFIAGNPENQDATLLHEKAMDIMKDTYSADKREKRSNFNEYMAKERASSWLNDIVKAAVEGRVDTLFINSKQHTWGKYDSKAHLTIVSKERQKDDICLLDFAAKAAYKQGANIYQMTREELPQPTANINATFRY